MGAAVLHTAAGNGRAASVRRLLAHGADPNLGFKAMYPALRSRAVLQYRIGGYAQSWLLQ
jgi:ankyrin repeat protein